MTTSLTAPLAVAGGLPGFPSLRMGAEINHGYFGRVYRAFDPKEQRDFAIKVVEKTRLNEKQRQNVRNEVTDPKYILEKAYAVERRGLEGSGPLRRGEGKGRGWRLRRGVACSQRARAR